MSNPASAMKRRLLLIFAMALALALLAGVARFAFFVHRYANVMVPNMYALEWVGGIMLDYLKEHDDRWPQSWDDLRPIYERHAQAAGRPWTFEDLRSRVVIDFSADVASLRRASAASGPPSFRVIYLRDGGREHWGSYEPNQMLQEYFSRRSAPR